MEKYCDHKSVGVILTNEYDEIALLKRARFPIAIAPPAGHIDSHGTPEQAAIEEVYEEIGIQVNLEDLAKTSIVNRRVFNVCRREGGDYHDWTVYEANVTKQNLQADLDETNGAEWYSRDTFRKLAAKSLHQTVATPGTLEPVWLDFMTELGYLEN